MEIDNFAYVVVVHLIKEKKLFLQQTSCEKMSVKQNKISIIGFRWTKKICIRPLFGSKIVTSFFYGAHTRASENWGTEMRAVIAYES